MPKEHFPRMRSRNFDYIDLFNVPSYQTGRLDLILNDMYSSPKSYKMFAMANGIVDAFTNRPGIRPATEALENEVVLRGVRPSQAKNEAKAIDELRVLGSRDWLSYKNMHDGNITDVTSGRIMFVPSPDTAVAWLERYDTLADADGSEDID